MEKVRENVDLSKQVLDIDVESPIFKQMMTDLNQEVKRVIEKVFNQEFESGDINLKLNLDIINGYQEYYDTDETTGEQIEEVYRYKKPLFKHTVTSTLQKKYKNEGGYSEDKEVIFEDGQYKVKPIINPQLNIEDFIKEAE